MLKPITSLNADQVAACVQWQAAGPWQSVMLANVPYGVLTHAVACAADGTPAFDLPVWWERGGAICVTIDEQDRFVLVRQYRPVPVALDQPMPYPTLAYEHCGVSSLEFPRGYIGEGETGDAAAAREAEEETGLEAVSATALAWNNANTSCFPYSQRVYVVRLDSRRPAQRQPDDHEQIQEVLFLTRQELLARIAAGEVFCGLTKSALMSYMAQFP